MIIVKSELNIRSLVTATAALPALEYMYHLIILHTEAINNEL